MDLKILAFILLKPTQGIDYFVRYYFWVEQIWLFHNWKICCLVKFNNFLMALASVHFFYLTFWCPNDALQRAIHFDSFSLMLGKEQINLISLLGSLMLLYYNHQLYVTTNYPLVRMLYPVIVHNDWRSFFIREKFNSQNVCRVTRKCFLLILNLFNCLVVMFGNLVYFLKS